MRLGMILRTNRDRTAAEVVAGPDRYSVIYSQFLELRKTEQAQRGLGVLALVDLQQGITLTGTLGKPVAMPVPVAAGDGEPVVVPRKRRNPGDGQI